MWIHSKIGIWPANSKVFHALPAGPATPGGLKNMRRMIMNRDAELHASLEKWAADELRSVNAQIEFLLTDVTRRAGRLRAPGQGGSGKRRET